MIKLKRTVVFQLMLLCGLLLVPFSAFAAATISVAPAGNGAFVLQASGLDAPAGMDITVTYDSSRLSNPRVVQGSLTSGAMLASNTGVAGTVRFAVVSTRAMNGSGPIATINFDPVGDSAGTITVKGTVINLAGKTLSVSFSGWTAPAAATVADSTTATDTTDTTDEDDEDDTKKSSTD